MQIARIKQGSLVEIDKELVVWPCEFIDRYTKKELEAFGRTKKEFFFDYLKILFEVYPPYFKNRRIKIKGGLLNLDGSVFFKEVICWYGDLVVSKSN